MSPLRYILGAAVLWIVVNASLCAAEVKAGSDPGSQHSLQQEKLQSIRIPRLVWKEVKKGEAFKEWSRLVRENDPSGTGIPLSALPDTELDPTFWKNAWDVSAEELLAHICIETGLQYRFSNQGLELVASKLPHAQRPSAGWQPEATRTYAVPDRLKKDSEDIAKQVGRRQKQAWKPILWERAAMGIPAENITSFEWLKDGKSFRVKADPQILDEIAVHLGIAGGVHRLAPATLNAGEEKLLKELSEWQKVAIPKVQVDAPTVREAVEKLTAIVREAPNGEVIRENLKFLDERIAKAGPVHFQHSVEKPVAGANKDEAASALLFLADMLVEHGGTVRGNPDGTWGIAGCRLGEEAGYLVIREYRVPAEVLRSKRPTKNSGDIGMGCDGVAFPLGCFAMYSPASSTLIVKNTFLEQLRLRKALNEIWPKSGANGRK